MISTMDSKLDIELDILLEIMPEHSYVLNNEYAGVG
jgi:hypothetical protein